MSSLGEHCIEGGDKCLGKPEREYELGARHEKLAAWSAIAVRESSHNATHLRY